MSWSPKPGYLIAAWVGAALATAWLLSTDDPAGRVLAVAAVVLLGALAAHATLVRPRLAADGAGLRLGGWHGSRAWPWSAVHQMAVVGHVRFGREVRMLELDLVSDDGRERFVVLTALDLGTDPREVAETLHALRPPG